MRNNRTIIARNFCLPHLDIWSRLSKCTVVNVETPKFLDPVPPIDRVCKVDGNFDKGTSRRAAASIRLLIDNIISLYDLVILHY